MAELKTRENDGDVDAFIGRVEDPQQQEDSRALVKLMREVTKKEPRMWGDSMIGFGRYHYKSRAGNQGEWFRLGFSPRKGTLSIYLFCGIAPLQEHLDRLGKHKMGKGCLYIKRLSDVDGKVLKAMLKHSLKSAPDSAHITVTSTD